MGSKSKPRAKQVSVSSPDPRVGWKMAPLGCLSVVASVSRWVVASFEAECSPSEVASSGTFLRLYRPSSAGGERGEDHGKRDIAVERVRRMAAESWLL